MMQEKDPNGTDPHTPGAKLDNGKPRVGMVLDAFARALLEVAKVGTFGANKYTDNGWLSVPNAIPRYVDAGYRHRLYLATGEETDQDSGLLHRAHEAWNALAVLELTLREKDDRLGEEVHRVRERDNEGSGGGVRGHRIAAGSAFDFEVTKSL